MSNRMPVRSRIVLVFSILFVLSVMVPTSFAGKDLTPVEVVDSVAKGNVVYVTVKNLTRTAQTVYVFAEATVDGKDVRGVTPVSIFPKGEVQAVVGFTGTVEEVGSVGINESGNPM